MNLLDTLFLSLDFDFGVNSLNTYIHKIYTAGLIIIAIGNLGNIEYIKP